MKTKQDLEKMFDEEYLRLYGDNTEYGNIALKKFIFETIIPEVLKSIMINPEGFTDYDYNSELKQKAKELFNINL